MTDLAQRSRMQEKPQGKMAQEAEENCETRMVETVSLDM
jgi:hypothetical protein